LVSAAETTDATAAPVVGTYLCCDVVAFRSVTVRRDARDAAGPRTARAVEYLRIS